MKFQKNRNFRVTINSIWINPDICIVERAAFWTEHCYLFQVAWKSFSVQLWFLIISQESLECCHKISECYSPDYFYFGLHFYRIGLHSPSLISQLHPEYTYRNHYEQTLHFYPLNTHHSSSCQWPLCKRQLLSAWWLF